MKTQAYSFSLLSCNCDPSKALPRPTFLYSWCSGLLAYLRIAGMGFNPLLSARSLQSCSSSLYGLVNRMGSTLGSLGKANCVNPAVTPAPWPSVLDSYPPMAQQEEKMSTEARLSYSVRPHFAFDPLLRNTVLHNYWKFNLTYIIHILE